MLRIMLCLPEHFTFQQTSKACCLCCILRSDISHLESQTVLLQIMSSRNLCLYIHIALSYALTSRKMRVPGVVIYGLQVRVIRVIPETCIENDSLRMNGLADGQHRVC